MVGGDERGSAIVGDSPTELAHNGNGEEEGDGGGRWRMSPDKTKGGGFTVSSSSGDILGGRGNGEAESFGWGVWTGKLGGKFVRNANSI